VEYHEQLQFPGQELLDRYDKFLSRELPKSVLSKIGLELLVREKLDSNGVTILEASIYECQRQLSRKFMATISAETPKEFIDKEVEGSLLGETQSTSDVFLWNSC
jgi:hypothetical protein